MVRLARAPSREPGPRGPRPRPDPEVRTGRGPPRAPGQEQQASDQPEQALRRQGGRGREDRCRAGPGGAGVVVGGKICNALSPNGHDPYLAAAARARERP